MNKIIKFVLLGLAAVVGLMILGALGAYMAVSGDYSPPPTVEHDSALPVIEIDGYRFHGETFGKSSSPVVIVLHGGPGMTRGRSPL